MAVPGYGVSTQMMGRREFDSIFPRMSKLKLWVAKFYKKLAGIGNTFSYFPIYTHFVKNIVLEYCNGHFGVVEICILLQI